MTSLRLSRPGLARAISVLAAIGLSGPLVVACSSDEDAAPPPSTPSVDRAEAAQIAVELADAPSAERLQAVVDALPELSEETYDQVGVLAELPDGVLGDDVVTDNVASFGDEATGWFVVERRAGGVEENETAVVERLAGEGYVEGEEVDLEGMPNLRIFERTADNTAVGINVSDVADQAADGGDFPTRIGYLTTPEVQE